MHWRILCPLCQAVMVEAHHDVFHPCGWYKVAALRRAEWKEKKALNRWQRRHDRMRYGGKIS